MNRIKKSKKDVEDLALVLLLAVPLSIGILIILYYLIECKECFSF